MAAQDAAARRLQRDLHDGAQQQLVALAVKLGLAQELMATEPAMVESVLAELQDQTKEALQNLRDLARGIYPPVLLDHGLVAAIRGYVAKSALPAEVLALGVGRHAQEIEGAVYFSCTEALQNVAKYSRCSSVVVTLEDREGELRFLIEDDGVGFSVEETPPGTGLQNMTDRIAAVGGTLEVNSEPGRGTLVTGRIPSRAPQPVG